MFTGIIETTGRIGHVTSSGGNRDFWIESSITKELKIDQSLAHNGVCLTVVDVDAEQYRVTAVEETLNKTTLENWTVGTSVNLERALRVGDRLDGHFVQGHVDAVAQCITREEVGGSWLFQFRFPAAFAALIVEKGSVCLDGVSLTAFNVGSNSFTVAIIPFTFAHTCFGQLLPAKEVNIEFDILGKYFLRKESLKG